MTVTVWKTDAEYYAAVAAGFDRLSENYDARYEGNPALDLMRRQALEMILRHARPGSWWLEVGCGTGRDALTLAGRGVNVLATDISSGMLDRLRRRLAAESPTGRVLTEQMGTGDLERLLPEWEGRFDGAALLFGAMNYEPHPERVAPILSRLLRPDARVVASVRNRFCAWETLYYLLYRPSPRRAFRRLGIGPVPTDLGGTEVGMRVYTPGAFARLFSPWFRREFLRGQSVALPPYMVEKFHVRFPRLAPRLARLDEMAGAWPFVRALGDHFLVVLRRSES